MMSWVTLFKRPVAELLHDHCLKHTYLCWNTGDNDYEKRPEKSKDGGSGLIVEIEIGTGTWTREPFEFDDIHAEFCRPCPSY